MIYSISITWYKYPRTMNKGTTKSALYVNQVDLRITHYLSLFPPICQCWFLSSTDLVFAGSCKVCLPTEDRQQEAVSLSHRLVLLPLLISNKTELGSLAYRTTWLWICDDYRINDIYVCDNMVIIFEVGMTRRSSQNGAFIRYMWLLRSTMPWEKNEAKIMICWPLFGKIS